MGLPYKDRNEAARVLADLVREYKNHPGVLALGLPRGGVPVADEAARELGAPWGILMVRKLMYMPADQACLSMPRASAL